MEFDCEGVRRLLGKYKFRDLTVEELKNVNMYFPHFRYSMDTYVFKDTSQKDLLNFTGTIPVMYQGNTYNIPIRFWILDSHPFAPPICFLKPTANMEISVGKHVDAKGRIYLPYLQNWSHGIADKLLLLDLSDGTNQGTMDLDIFNLPNVEISKDLSASAHSKVVIFTANSLGGFESYLHAVQSNVDMFRTLVPALGHYNQHAVFLVASQPVEIMSYVTWKLSTFPANRVIGIGCNLDSQRLQYIIMNVLKAQTSGKKVWVVGEQGENKVCSWSGPDGVMSHSSQAELSSRAMELLRVKGQRSWSVGLSVADLVDTIVNNKKKVHSVSTLAKGYYGLDNEVFLSLPCILGTSGVSEVKTTAGEDPMTETLQNSGSSIHNLQQQLKL
ncbi:ubiquitin-conjugating enzyme E2 variant 3 isoform X4 [Cricetulus griseus]|uniref:Ubiquitin-conjugating enzyme E2 variant 3 isoform X4 n=1 Tax=Cricetulus griseus TaxID=10029 RepID=A0A9J7JMW8_CRIGR|nr:ubiquitin-conjugating enzyme E2 variant 3 isoform X4 [Cricetulus griseus]XP_027266279.1 ubiquitin-conjugating enzyme E2 variant 3 isoform X4 [Cricetulus griseus]